MKNREVLPCQASGVLGAVGDIGSKHRPSPALGPAVLEPNIHRGKTAHLAEDLLLTRLGGDGLSKQLPNLTRIEVIDEAPDARLAKAGEALHEIEPLTDGGVWVVVNTLLGCGLTKHVGQKGGVAAFLVSHELDQGHVFGVKTGRNEVSFGELCKTVME